MREVILTRGPGLRRAVLLTVVVAGPVIIAPKLAWDPINVPKMALLFTGVGVAAAIRLLELGAGASASGLRRALVPAVAIALPLLIAWLLGDHREWTAWGLYPRFLGLVPYLFICLFGILLADAFGRDPRRLGWALLSAGALVGLYSSIQVLRIDPFVWDVETTEFGIVRASSTLGNPNFTGAFLAVVMPVGLAISLWDEGRRDVAWVLTALTAFGWIVSFSQGPWLAGAAGVALVAAVALKPRWPKALSAATLLAGLCAAIAIGAVVATMVSDEAADALGPTVESRGWFWETAASMISDEPLTGFGPNVFAVEGVRYRPADEALISYWVAEDPHDLTLSHTVAAGLLGAAGVLFFAVWIVRRARSELAGPAGIRIGMAAAAVAYLLQGLVGVDEPGVRLAGWVAIAGIATAGSTARDPAAPKKFWLAGALAVGGLLIAVTAWTSWSWVRADGAVRTGFLAALNDQPEAVIEHFSDALGLRNDYEYRLLYGTKIGELATKRGAAGAAYFAEMRDAFSYLEHFPQITGYVSEARLVLAWGEKVDPSVYPLALSLFEAARELDPHHPLLAVETSDALRALDREEQALQLLEGFLPRDPPQPQFYGALALVNAEAGNLSEARRWADIALEMSPEDARALLAQGFLAEPSLRTRHSNESGARREGSPGT